MAGDRLEHAQQANRRVDDLHWYDVILGGLSLVWLVFSLAALIYFGPLVAEFMRYRIICGAVEAIGGIATVYSVLQFPPFRRRTFAWPSFAEDIFTATGFAAWTYAFETVLFPVLPNPRGGAGFLGTLLLLVVFFRMPGPLHSWISRHIGSRHAPQAPTNPA